MKQIVEKAKKIIRKAGVEVMKIYNDNFDHEIKEDNSPVTDADKISDEVLLSELKHFGYPILSEESFEDYNNLNNDKFWIVDSLDGTTDFIQKTGDFSIMVGLVESNRPILGLVYLPVIDKLYYAIKNQGSYLEVNNIIKQIRVSNIKKINNSRLVVSRNHLKPEDEKKAKDMGIYNLKKSGSNGIKMGLIAEGVADIFYNTTNKMSYWDSCGPEIILTEAGGKVTDVKGDAIIYNKNDYKLANGLVASNGLLHNLIINKLSK